MRIKGWLILLCVVVLIALTTIVFTDVRREWTQRVDEAERRLESLAHTLEEHVLRTFHVAELLLYNVAISPVEEGPPVLSPGIVRNAQRIPYVTSMLVASPDGRIVGDTHGIDAEGMSIAGCSCFDAHARGEIDGMLIDVVRQSFADPRGDATMLSFSQALTGVDGGFAGVAVVLLDPAYLADFYDAVRVGENGIVSLFRTDGLLLVQTPSGTYTPGDSVAGHPVFEHMVAGGRHGVYHTIDPAVDFVDIVAWANMDTYPLTLSVSAMREEVLAGWSDRVFWSVTSLVGLTIAILSLVGYLLVQIGRQQRTQQALTVQKSYFQQLFDTSPEGVVILDNNDRIVDVNRGFQKLFQYDVDEVKGLALNELIMPEGMGEEGTVLSRRVLQHEQVQVEKVRKRKDGSLVHVSILGTPIMMQDNQVGVYGIYRDITRRIEAEREIHDSEERHRVVAEQTGQLIYDYNVLTGKITWSGAIRKMTGYDYEEFQAVDVDGWAEMIHPEDRDEALRLLDEARERCTHYASEYRMRRKNGTWMYIEDHGAFMQNDDGVVHRMLGSMSDITERKRISREMAYQASHDALTGLVNRHEFEERVSQLLTSRRGGHRRHALLFIDLDQFKVVNDTCGHQAGDDLLRQLTGLMAATVRDDDTLARLGGDEFGLLLMDCPLDKALDIASGIIATINEFRFIWDDKTFTIGASAGLVEITRHTESVAALFSAADSACYAAKDKGRNRIVVYSEGDQEMVQRQGEMAWVSRITKALEEDRFELHWQPIVAVGAPDDGRHHGELLIRMVNEDGTLTMPGSFIPAAERYNLMPALDRWVIRRALDLLGERSDMLASVNVSGISLGADDFVDYVVDELNRSQVDPSVLCFEITETSAIANLQRAREFIARMHELGCSIALDDFGSGLSSFAYLKTLPVDFMKIDGAFVKDIIDDPTDHAMVEAIIRIGEVMDIQTIAEFVESDEILAHLRKMNVGYAQGYALQRPQPWEDAFGAAVKEAT